ncbi:MAG: MBL fold metallo-hydrolase [Deltaproteobacteria bacterium]|nr:MBL fold metallo-hydrolase [Deltaproteobacteria bacterium]
MQGSFIEKRGKPGSFRLTGDRMEAIFLGTGSAWGLPEHGCRCQICEKMRLLGEERLRTSILVRGKESILVDCGPDMRIQLIRNRVDHIDALLITHGHSDHYIGLDELEALRRNRRQERWSPVPAFATEKTWEIVGRRFDYLLGKLLEKRSVRAGRPLDSLRTRVTPFRTVHSDSAGGSVGYVFEEETGNGPKRLVYTSDFVDVPGEDSILENPDILILSCNSFNEPASNQPGHMSFQRAIEYIRKWSPKSAVFLVHISDVDVLPGDEWGGFKKVRPLDPMKSPVTGLPYKVPTCHREWQERVDRVIADLDISCKVTVAHDGLRALLW